MYVSSSKPSGKNRRNFRRHLSGPERAAAMAALECKSHACSRLADGITCDLRRRGQVVRRQTANLLLVGSIPTGASEFRGRSFLRASPCFPLLMYPLAEENEDRVKRRRP